MPRVRMSLDGAWEFFPDPHQKLQPDALDGEGAGRPIRVPGPWQAQFEDLRKYTGVAWYRRTFRVPRAESWHSIPNPIFLLLFGAVDYYTSVWLNGQPIGDHEGGYLPFELVCGDALTVEGENELVIRVVDPGDDAEIWPQFAFDEVPHGKQSWYGPIGGIWQSVSLEMRYATFLSRLHITPDVANEQAHIEMHLNRPLAFRSELVMALTDPRGEVTRHLVVIEKGEQAKRALIPIPNPMLWDTHAPDLYYLDVSLLSDREEEPLLDSLASHFGMRTIATSPEGHLMLNGRVLYLRGALDQDYYPDLVYTPFSDAELDGQFAKAKHMGLNCLRTHIKITDPRYYDAADRAGLLIWTELPNWERLTEVVKQRACETLTQMVERDWNHPSIIIWTIVNESWGVDLAANPEHRAWLSDTYDLLKRLDPYRLVVGNSACFSNFHVVTDIQDFHNYYSIPDHYREWNHWVEAFAARPPWVYAHRYENIKAWREFLKDPWTPRALTPAPEVRRTGMEPIVVSEFGNWGLPDVDKLRDCYGGKDPWWFETGMETGDGAVYPHGVRERFESFHLDKVFPTLSDLASASQRMQFTALKYQIEQMRRHPSIVGYIITEFTDVHWESNGLLDMCRNPKSYYDAIANINSADVIVPEWERVAFWEGERCRIPLVLSHFSPFDLEGGRLEWKLDRGKWAQGTLENLNPKSAEITTLGCLEFSVPLVEHGTRARLEFRLYDARGTLVTGNHQELYFFPRRLGMPPQNWRLGAPPELAAQFHRLGYTTADDLQHADIVVVNKMTDEMRWYAQSGGRVLWLAESAEANQTYLNTVEIEARKGRRWQGDWASNLTWIRQDKMFGEIPTGGTVDFAFADLTPDQVIVGLHPRDFASEVHAGMFVGWLHHAVGVVANLPLGRGCVLVSTFRLSKNMNTQPVAAIMLRDMLEFLANGK